jgi:3D (Asp-Asp-Asp) domain-containing protein
MRLMRARSFLHVSVVVLIVSTGLWWLVRTVGPQPPRESATDAAAAATLGPLSAGARHAFTATAYCKGHTTRAGVAPRRGVIASDPAVLPLGSIVEIDADNDQVDGLYSVLDTGPKVRGRRIDLYMWSCHEALAFGKQSVEVTVLRAGWNPTAVSTSATNAND